MITHISPHREIHTVHILITGNLSLCLILLSSVNFMDTYLNTIQHNCWSYFTYSLPIGSNNYFLVNKIITIITTCKYQLHNTLYEESLMAVNSVRVNNMIWLTKNFQFPLLSLCSCLTFYFCVHYILFYIHYKLDTMLFILF